MKTARFLFALALAFVFVAHVAASAAQAEEARQSQNGASEKEQGDSWTKSRGEGDKHNTLQDAYQYVRGDSGKWNDEPDLQLAPPLAGKPEGQSLDDWFDQLSQKKVQPAGGDKVLLLFRTRQLDDNDRVWVERIERRGNRFTIYASEAIWQGRYNKTFTYYSVLGVNLGPLEPGQYEAKWIVKPLAFNKFDDPSARQASWPQDARPADEETVELRTAFRVVPAGR